VGKAIEVGANTAVAAGRWSQNLPQAEAALGGAMSQMEYLNTPKLYY
jgi:hypothetical protein